jgi:hypothetical protein
MIESSEQFIDKKKARCRGRKGTGYRSGSEKDIDKRREQDTADRTK